MANLQQQLHLLSIAAGGPGSGRKPGFAKFGDLSKSHEAVLEKMHKSLTKKGFKYVGSETPGRIETNHYYKGTGSREGQQAYIKQHASNSQGSYKLIDDTKKFPDWVSQGGLSKRGSIKE